MITGDGRGGTVPTVPPGANRVQLYYTPGTTRRLTLERVGDHDEAVPRPGALAGISPVCQCITPLRLLIGHQCLTAVLAFKAASQRHGPGLTQMPPLDGIATESGGDRSAVSKSIGATSLYETLLC